MDREMAGPVWETSTAVVDDEEDQRVWSKKCTDKGQTRVQNILKSCLSSMKHTLIGVLAGIGSDETVLKVCLEWR